MKKIIILCSFFLVHAAVADEKESFGTCSVEVKTHCSASEDKHAKHDCLKKLDETKLSQSCLDYRKKILSSLKKSDDHDDDHDGHKHK